MNTAGKPLKSGVPIQTTRRAFVKAVAAAGAGFGLVPLLRASDKKEVKRSTSGNRTHVAVIGGGAFGGWTALYLLRQGARVTLIDAWGPGNSRASSGGETRVIRAIYGTRGIYVKMAARAAQLWRENEARWNRKLYHRTGALWMISSQDVYVEPSLPFLRQAGLEFEELTVDGAGRRYPQVNFSEIHSAYFEKEAGYLSARLACQAVLEGFIAEGGEYIQAYLRPLTIRGNELRELKLSNLSTLGADKFVFACGPWLATVLPGVLGSLIQPSRQEVYFFGTPAGDSRFNEDALPVWVEVGERLLYGIPANEGRGFKIADDTRGPAFDPTAENRVPTAQGIEAARAYLGHRFPALRGAPLLESRVCQYENSPDANFILDRHPSAANVWIAGGGSGHGFKHGPVVGEMMADLVMGEKPGDPFFALARFKPLA